MPAWLADLDHENVTIREHDVSRELPGRHRRRRLRHPRGGDRLTDLLPAAPDRDDGRERQRAPPAARPLRRAGADRAPASRASCSSRAARSTATRRPTRSRPARRTAGNVSCTGPRACYDESKRFGETLCVNFARQHGLPVTIARPFNNYGPGLKITDGRVIPDFARDILDGRDIVLLSDGSPTRTFCYVADAVSRLLSRCSSAGRPARRTTSASSVPRSRSSTLRSGCGTRPTSCSGTTGHVVHGQQRRGRLPRRQPEPPLPGHRQGAHRRRLRADDRARRGTPSLPALVRGERDAGPAA